MKIQSLAVIFIIIILPISLVLSSYLQNQITTLNLQTSYDFKLTNATYDAVKAFQLNTVNSTTSDIASSKIRDIEASASTFFNSVASNFGLKGNSIDAIQDYVPALVYTMYDGYYIYTKYQNNINGQYTLDSGKEISTDSTYQPNEYLNGLKSYVYYSSRYVKGNIDVTITYALDNYITVQGKIGSTPVNKAGYLLSNSSSDGQTYNGVQISNETLTEYVGSNQYSYIKINGVKYYEDINNEDSNNATGYFSLINGKKVFTTTINGDIQQNDSAIQYYKKAYEFTNWVKSELGSLKYSDAVSVDGLYFTTNKNETSKQYTEITGLADSNLGIFDGVIEEEKSNFNQHRLAVIRYSIESNLSVAIANFNAYTGVTTNFQMPNLKEEEWNTIINNISVISFLQGLSIGGKIYNGYSIVPNNTNEEFISNESILIASTDTNNYYRITDKTIPTTSIIGFSNVEFENKYLLDDNNKKVYYYPQRQLGSYTSIVGHTGIAEIDNLYSYISSLDVNIKKAYYTAIARERYGMYRPNYDTYMAGV